MKSKNARPARIAAVFVLVCACACVVSTIIALATMGLVYGMPPEVGDVLTYLYQINAFFCMAAALFAVAVLFVRGRRAVMAKSALWAMLILAIMYVTPFMTDTISYLSSMSFLPAFRYACAYLPFVALIVSVVAVLTTWGAAMHRAASITCMAGSLCAVFCGIVYLWQVWPAALEAETQFDQAQIWAIVAGFISAIAVPIVLWFGSLTEQTWLETLIGVDEADAPFAAEAAKRLEAVRETMIDRIRAEYDRKQAEKDAAPEAAGEDEKAEETSSAARPESDGADVDSTDHAPAEEVVAAVKTVEVVPDADSSTTAAPAQSDEEPGDAEDAKPVSALDEKEKTDRDSDLDREE